MTWLHLAAFIVAQLAPTLLLYVYHLIRARLP